MCVYLVAQPKLLRFVALKTNWVFNHFERLLPNFLSTTIALICLKRFTCLSSRILATIPSPAWPHYWRKKQKEKKIKIKLGIKSMI